ncbi:hypothetical protein F8M41_017625 [Gigaspora margarita]|uniref:SbsA Ig-like domain-containing protein n=1 Tax=Gigaspora margarita TaxID=4874 RepID=A0A8H4B2S0_GIGMA|nr:hypothetical protein F8M41_017625 [Gigaspora margarita]
MKLSSIRHYFIIQYLFFCLLITLTESQQLPYKSFNYTENNLDKQNSTFLIADIKTYDDGTILLHIMRNESKQTENCSKIRGISFEQKLYIRLIFLNGTVKEIYPNLNLNPINYCLFNSDSTEYKVNKLNKISMYLNDAKNNNTHKNLMNPITIYPLQKPYFLITYVNTTNSSDPKSYKECGKVIDWNGKNKSEMCFDSGTWSDSTIQLNANKDLGFISFSRNKPYEKNGNSWNSWLWQQYSVDEDGNLKNSTNLINLPEISYEDSNTNYSLITIVPTVEDGYLAIFNYTNPRLGITPRIGLCAIPISYNNPKVSKKIVIFQAEQPINSVSCDEAGSFIYCIASIHFNNETFNGMIYEQIKIYPSGNVFSNQEIYSDHRSLNLRAKITSFGDLIFDVTEYNNTDQNIYYNIYYYNDSASLLEQLNSFIITNYFSVNAVAQNNALLLASPSTIDNISWSLLTIPLLNSSDYRYDNVFINKTIPSINDSVNPSTTLLNITFNLPVALSAPTSYITIYKASDKSIRQRISTTMHDFLNISSDGLSISIKVIKSTFNEYGEQYIVTMDNNFVKGVDLNEPLRGIHDCIWILKTDMAKDRKPGNAHYVYVYLFKINHMVLMSNSSDKPIMGLVRLTQEASKKFIALKNNQSAYIESLLNDIAKKVPINPSRLISKYKPQKFFHDQIVIPIRINAANDDSEKSAAKLASDLAYMIMFKDITTIAFGVTNDLDQNYNLRLLVITIDKGIKDPEIGDQFKEWIKDYRNLIAIFIVLIITDFEYLKILKDMPKYKCFKINKIFDKAEQINRLEYIFQVAIICGAFFDITFRNIPQIIIQVSKYLTLWNIWNYFYSQQCYVRKSRR